MVNEVSGALLNQHHLGDIVAMGFGEFLLPDDGDGTGSAEDGDEFSSPEETLLTLILSTDFLQVVFGHNRLQAIGNVPDAAGMVNGRRSLHEIGHDRIGDCQNLGVGFIYQVRFRISFHPGRLNGALWEILPTPLFCLDSYCTHVSSGPTVIANWCK